MFTKEFLKSKVKNFDFRLREDKVVCYTKEELFEVLLYRLALIEQTLTSPIAPNLVDIRVKLSNELDEGNEYFFGFRTYRMDYLDMLEGFFKGIETRGFDILIQSISIQEVPPAKRRERIREHFNLNHKIMDSIFKNK